MQRLAERLRQRIEREGPISLSEYMAIVLTDPRDGYYMVQDPFGASGDFVTAPEVSQMFGELVGLWCVALWESIGRPQPFAMVELGPGRGTLLSDALRAASLSPGFMEAVEVRLIEASPKLEALQRERLATEAAGVPLAWHRNLGELPESPIVLVANEFFDALPVKQFQLTEVGWAERLVGLAENSGELTFVLGQPSPLNDHRLPEKLRKGRPGDKAEVSPACLALAAEIGRRLAEAPGAALIIDYGHAQSRHTWTLQAMRGHRATDPLKMPGRADLTAHVDFEAISETARGAGAASFGPVEQGDFLKALGITLRADRLKRGAEPERVSAIDDALHRLTAPSEMGAHFKVLALTSPGTAAPAGFEECRDAR